MRPYPFEAGDKSNLAARSNLFLGLSAVVHRICLALIWRINLDPIAP